MLIKQESLKSNDSATWTPLNIGDHIHFFQSHVDTAEGFWKIAMRTDKTEVELFEGRELSI